ncbi:MAG: serine/threonine protein kinase [Caldisericia bacterium]|nr:serine/threonine protein kinase [Caldisericia bacterium]
MIGRTLGGKYKIYDKVGGGGMAEVYLARDITKGQIVALKILREQYTQGADYIERFKREAESAMKLQHENICAVMDFGNEGQTYFMVMEFIEGKTLTSHIEQTGPLPLSEAISYMIQSVKALDRAYKSGIIAHRDIKSQNLMITPTGQVKIMDFGIAKSRDFATMTTTGSFIGTPEYMSPEQAQGLKVDGRTDFYSLGVVFYEMLAGEVPFESDTPWGVLNMHITKEPFPLNNLRKDVPQDIIDVIGHMMAKNPDDRYQNCAELLSALSILAAKFGGHKQGAVKAKKVPRSNPRVKRNIAKVAIIIGTIAILVGGFLFGWQMLKPKPGSVSITSNPAGAQIRLKGISETEFKSYGVTNKPVEDLPPGAYDLELQLDGYVSNTKQIEIKSGELLPLETINLQKPGKLSLLTSKNIAWGKVEKIPGPQEIKIKNVGQYKLIVKKEISADWVSVDSESMTLEQNVSKAIPISINPNKIQPGKSYKGFITLTPDQGEPVVISLSLTFSETGKIETAVTPTKPSNQTTSSGNTSSSNTSSNTTSKPSNQDSTQKPVTPAEGTLSISCNVPTANIKVNGVQVGTGSVTLKKTPGTYQIEIVAPGYKAPSSSLPVYKTSTSVVAGKTAKISVTFRK